MTRVRLERRCQSCAVRCQSDRPSCRRCPWRSIRRPRARARLERGPVAPHGGVLAKSPPCQECSPWFQPSRPARNRAGNRYKPWSMPPGTRASCARQAGCGGDRLE